MGSGAKLFQFRLGSSGLLRGVQRQTTGSVQDDFANFFSRLSVMKQDFFDLWHEFTESQNSVLTHRVEFFWQ